MKYALITSSLLDFAQGLAFKRPYQTLTIPVPAGGATYTATIPPCGTLPGYVLIPEANKTFHPGTTTVFAPPQASKATRTFVDTEYDETAVVIVQPLPGSCAPEDLRYFPTNTYTDLSQFTATDLFLSPTVAALAAVCPLTDDIDYSAAKGPVKDVVDGINNATLILQSLQWWAEQIGVVADNTTTSASVDSTALSTLSAVTSTIKQARNPGAGTGLIRRQEPITAVLRLLSGLRDVGTTLTSLLPDVAVLPPFKPSRSVIEILDDDDEDEAAGDAVVGALLSLVTIHRALLNTLIGRARLVHDIPVESAAVGQLAAVAQESADELGNGRLLRGRHVSPVGTTIAKVLQALEDVVDQLAFEIIRLVPAREECSKKQKKAIDETFEEAIAAYEA
ncbi:hypothetical protein DIS24_g1106 [Lasiodiplodia hormozganensis]|uniref:Uncharacterized protein n=1 Tax=Lasiodiplodia hormozganensis TaxID=869390 RepID=A0AA39Z3R2_9PEZI|nr:hypothetical protein DIS24_g1106 [Lasiodiplodia hormozganensis]